MCMTTTFQLTECDTHVMKPKTRCDLPVGKFALHDLLYMPPQ